MNQRPDSLSSAHSEELEVLMSDRRATIDAAVIKLEAFTALPALNTSVLAGEVEVPTRVTLSADHSTSASEALERVLAAY